MISLPLSCDGPEKSTCLGPRLGLNRVRILAATTTQAEQTAFKVISSNRIINYPSSLLLLLFFPNQFHSRSSEFRGFFRRGMLQALAKSRSAFRNNSLKIDSTKVALNTIQM